MGGDNTRVGGINHVFRGTQQHLLMKYHFYGMIKRTLLLFDFFSPATRLTNKYLWLSSREYNCLFRILISACRAFP